MQFRSRTLQLTMGVVVVSTAMRGADVVTQPVRSFGFGELRTLAVSPDETRLVTAGQTGAFVWNLATRELLHRIEAHGAPVTSVAFSSDGSVLATADRNGSIRTWVAATAAALRVINGHQRDVRSLSFSPDGRSLASASEDNYTRVWSLDTGQLLQAFRAAGQIMYAAVFTPDGTQLVTADSSFTNHVGLWSIATGARVRSFGDHIGEVRALVFLPDGQLATGGADQKVRLWNISTGQRVRTLDGATAPVAGLIARGNSSLLTAGCFDGRILTWDATTGSLIHNLKRDSLIAMSASLDAQPLAIATSDYLVELIDPTAGSVTTALSDHTTSTFTGVSFSPDERFVIAGGVEKLTRLWTRTNAQSVRTFPGQGGGTAAATFSPDGARVLSTIGFPHKAAQVWRADTGQLERELLGHTDWLTMASFSTNGRMVVTASLDGSVRLWNADTGAGVRTFTGHAGGVYAAALSPDTNLVAGGGGSSDPTARVWNALTGQLLQTFGEEAGAVRALSFSPSSARLLVGWEGGLVRVFEVVSGTLTLEFVVPSGFLSAAAFSPDGQFILTADNFPTFAARLWDADSGEMLRVFAGHTASVNAVAFNPRGNLILTGGDNVRLWNIGDLASRLRTVPRPGGLELRWTRGMLQRAWTVDGPWDSDLDATSPWWVDFEGAPARFFRVASPVEQ